MTRHCQSIGLSEYYPYKWGDLFLFLYQVSVPENSLKGTTVAKIVAKDADSGEFGTAGIRYTELRGSVADM